jgi:YVTN family beta-propeller protein
MSAIGFNLNRPSVGLTLLIALVAVCGRPVASGGAVGPQPDRVAERGGANSPRLKALLQERRNTLRTLAAQLGQAAEHGVPSVKAHQASLAALRAELDLCETDRERVLRGAAVAPFALAAPAAGSPAEPAPAQVLVVNTQDASVSLVDLAAMKEVKRFPVGPRPYGVAVSRDGKTVAVGVEDEERVKFFALPDFAPKGECRIGRMFNDHIVLSRDGRHVLVANFYSDDVVAIDVETMKEAFRIKDCSAPHVVKYGPLRKHAYVTCKKITGIAIIDPEGRRLVKFHQLNVNPRSLTFSPDESRLYFGLFWVNGFFEMDTAAGKVTRLFAYPPPEGNAGEQEVTYHGVEAVYPNVVLAANEGRSYVDAADVRSGKLLGRLADVSKPCCVERVPGTDPVRVLVSNIGDGTLQLVEVTPDGAMKTLGKAAVGKAPKRVAFLLPAAS